MKYVKIYDSNLTPCGVVDIEGDMSAASGKYVKVLSANMQLAGVIQLGNEMTDAQKALLFQAYDQNLMLVGVGMAESLSPAPSVIAVDLGLPSGTLWATCNLGANSPEEAGLYFQWGDTQGYTADQVGTGEGQKIFADDFSDYKFGTPENMSKYNDTDGKTVLDAEDDAAHVMLGGSWAMPTVDQFEELFNDEYTTNEWVEDYQDSGVGGRLVTSKSNGNSIFFPAAGIAVGGSFDELGTGGYFWSSVLYVVEVGCSLDFRSVGVSPGSGSPRFLGLPVRPVQNAS